MNLTYGLVNLGKRSGYERLPDTPPLTSFPASKEPGENFPASVGDTLAKIIRTTNYPQLERLQHSLDAAAKTGGSGTFADAVNQFQGLDLALRQLRDLAVLPGLTPSQQGQAGNLMKIVKAMVGSGADLSRPGFNGHTPMVQSAMMFRELPNLSHQILDSVETKRSQATALGQHAASNASGVASPPNDPFFVERGRYTFFHALAASYPQKPDAAAFDYLKKALTLGAHAHQPYQGLTPLNYATAYRNTQFVIDFNRAMEELKAGTGAGR